MSWKTYGPRPQSFSLNGERYYIGSEVGNHLMCYKGTLYKRFPQLWKRMATLEERKAIQELGCSPAYVLSTIMLLKGDEVDELLDGHDEKFRAAPSGNNSALNSAYANAKLEASTKKPPTGWINQQVSSGSHHLESVPCCTPVAHGRGHLKNREFVSAPDDTDGYKRLLTNAGEQVDLVPIRLDMELDNIKLRDTFCYNKNEKLITPEAIAEVICEDLDLPVNTFLPAIAQSIYQQVEGHSEALPVDKEIAADQRAILKLNIHVGNQSLVDQFEWDVNEENNSPEEFAAKLCAELGLGGEFVSAAAYSIRGQLSWNQRTYAYSESPLPTVDNPFRSVTDAELWGPFLETLTDAEIEKKMRDQDRNTRRMRRLVNSYPGGI
jgi:SWI/SNF-related matrix-associated actin-dependent regulator of chromatin subfamily B protein 1